MTTGTTPLETPFARWHVDHGAKMVEFAGWTMPLHYGSILAEHEQTRTSGGLFDVSHMGRFRFSGRDARRFLDRVCTRQILGMEAGQARYSMVCNEQGGVRDDVLVYRLDDAEYMMVCNASNRLKLLDHFEAVRGDMVFAFEDQTLESAMIAVQGPKVMEFIGKYSREIPTLKRYRFTRIGVMGLDVIVSRTGYTGEDGVEVVFGTKGFAAKAALKIMMSDLGAADPIIKPAGLGARDSLRLEAAMALYGHEITEEIDPVSAGIMFAIKLDKGDDDPEAGTFIGQEALRRIHAEGPRRRLVGLRLDSRRAARQGARVLAGDAEAGVVTSGCLSPTLGASIAMALVDAGRAELGTALRVEVGSAPIDAEVVPMPFYKSS